MFASDNSGTFWGLTSLIIIVFAAIGVSSLTTKRFEFSSSAKSNSKLVQAEAETLSDLSVEKASLETRLHQEGIHVETAEQIEQLTKTLAEQQTKIDALKGDVKTARAHVTSVEESFAGYQKDYRSQIWLAAAGEKFPVIRLRTGREYKNATILRVTPVGLEIDHSEGRARLDAVNLDATWQERFQWNDAERLSTRGGERPQMEDAPAPPPVTQPKSSAVNTRPPPKPKISEAELGKIRNEFIAWNTKVFQLDSQYTEAQTKATQGGASSVPGSLETWAARAKRLETDLSRARDNQARARARLEIVSPNDSLLFR